MQDRDPISTTSSTTARIAFPTDHLPERERLCNLLDFSRGPAVPVSPGEDDRDDSTFLVTRGFAVVDFRFIAGILYSQFAV